MAYYLGNWTWYLYCNNDNLELLCGVIPNLHNTTTPPGQTVKKISNHFLYFPLDKSNRVKYNKYRK